MSQSSGSITVMDQPTPTCGCLGVGALAAKGHPNIRVGPLDALKTFRRIITMRGTKRWTFYCCCRLVSTPTFYALSIVRGSWLKGHTYTLTIRELLLRSGKLQKSLTTPNICCATWEKFCLIDFIIRLHVKDLSRPSVAQRNDTTWQILAPMALVVTCAYQ